MMLRERLYMENLFKNPKLEVANVKGTDMAWARAPHRWHSPILQNHHHCPPGRTKRSWKGEERASEVDVPIGRDCFLIKLVPLASELLPGHTTDPCPLQSSWGPVGYRRQISRSPQGFRLLEHTLCLRLQSMSSLYPGPPPGSLVSMTSSVSLSMPALDCLGVFCDVFSSIR